MSIIVLIIRMMVQLMIMIIFIEEAALTDIT